MVQIQQNGLDFVTCKLCGDVPSIRGPARWSDEDKVFRIRSIYERPNFQARVLSEIFKNTFMLTL